MFVKLCGFHCGKEEARQEVGRENAVCVRTERRCTHEAHVTLPEAEHYGLLPRENSGM